MSTPAERRANARLAAHERWAREPDRSAATAAARAASPVSLEHHVAAMRAAFPHATEDEITRRARNAHRAYMSRLAKAARAKRKDSAA